jgi:FolB domain-containing protein
MDRILISDLIARCVIGVNADERREKQDVIINLTVWTDLRRAAVSDKFEDTVDYRDLKKRVMTRVEKSTYFLLEALAEAIAQECMTDSRIEQVQVRVDKPLALRFARSVAVEINRQRGT